MKRKKKRNLLTKPIQAEVHRVIWDQLKIRATIEGLTTGEVLTKAIQLYLASKKGDALTLGIDFPFE